MAYLFLVVKLYFVFDVESVGLHGEGYAVGGVVVDSAGNQLEQFSFACPINAAAGGEEGFKWVRANAPELRQTHDSPWQLRAAFWKLWRQWQDKGALLVADCAWPVEARFLIDCVRDKPIEREWQGPYPLHDLASVLLGLGHDPLKKRERLAGELPEHDPLSDARQSARLLLDFIPVPTIP